MTDQLTNTFLSETVLRMEESRERIEQCVRQLDTVEVWRRPNSQLSSVANLVLHLCGNITQYVISSLGNMPDQRDRDGEFAAEGGSSPEELTSKINNVIRQATDIIGKTTTAELLRVREVQGFQMTGMGICIHVTEHLSYHTGQIAMHTKLLKERDLGFYVGMDLNIKNK